MRKVDLVSSCFRPGTLGSREGKLACPHTVFQGSRPCCSSFATSPRTPVTRPGCPSSLPTRSVLLSLSWARRGRMDGMLAEQGSAFSSPHTEPRPLGACSCGRTSGLLAVEKLNPGLFSYSLLLKKKTLVSPANLSTMLSFLS